MTLLERFIEYVKIPTSSDFASNSMPTTEKQFVLADKLASELREMGVVDAHRDDMCYVYAHLPATPGYEDKKRIGFIAHLDTSPDYPDSPVNPQIHEDYDGEDVILGHGRTLSVKDFPHLKSLKGRTLITTDGSTLLGADDKAVIAEIMHTIQRIIKEDIHHGSVSIAFTPDEECGTSADNFDIEKFGAELAYTVDGGSEER